jgi:hypothetical protein
MKYALPILACLLFFVSGAFLGMGHLHPNMDKSSKYVFFFAMAVLAIHLFSI